MPPSERLFYYLNCEMFPKVKKTSGKFAAERVGSVQIRVGNCKIFLKMNGTSS